MPITLTNFKYNRANAIKHLLLVTLSDALYREPSLKGTAMYRWPPCTN